MERWDKRENSFILDILNDPVKDKIIQRFLTFLPNYGMKGEIVNAFDIDGLPCEQVVSIKITRGKKFRCRGKKSAIRKRGFTLVNEGRRNSYTDLLDNFFESF